MNAARAISWAAAGAIGAAAGLVASPGTYSWLRRRVGLEDEQVHYEASGDAGAAEVETPMSDARLSLRARLQDVGTEPAEPEIRRLPNPAAARVDENARLRLAVDAIRLRARGKAASSLAEADDPPA